MWYAIQVSTGKENNIKELCKNLIERDLYNDIFIITFDKAKKYHGIWHKENEIMFPGYIFIDTNNPCEIYEQLKKIPKLTKLLGRDGCQFTPIETNKEKLFKSIINTNYEIPISIGVIEGDKIIVKEGPLIGMEGLIKKINRHKRIAIINANLFDQKIDISIGLEIIQKI